MINKLNIFSSLAILSLTPNIVLSVEVQKVPKVVKHTISSDDFYLLLDTDTYNVGTINKDAKLGFRSSWGVWNRAESDGKFNFNISKQTILEHLGLQDNPNIVLKSFKPTKIGFLPVVAISDPPIVNAY